MGASCAVYLSTDLAQMSEPFSSIHLSNWINKTHKHKTETNAVSVFSLYFRNKVWVVTFFFVHETLS